MASFWLGVFNVDPAATATRSIAEPIVMDGASRLALEVIQDGDDYGVLISALDSVERPCACECRIGFTNNADLCRIWRDGGFPLVDATIRYDRAQSELTISSPFFRNRGSMHYDKSIMLISGVTFDILGGTDASLPLRYELFQQSLDPVAPGSYVLRKPVSWVPIRSNVRVLNLCPPLEFKLAGASCPNLRPFGNSELKLANVWFGDVDTTFRPQVRSQAAATRVKRADAFGLPAFRFENVEVLGFRIDLGASEEIDRRLSELIEPLNFHLQTPSGARVSDFRYKPATRTILVELLRYGRMKMKEQQEPLTQDDYQSQHELVVRLLVGRVDDDTAQARDGAVYVPAIFVDNPWSKIVGWDLQGFEKRLVDFCPKARDGRVFPLYPDGRFTHAADICPLGDVALVNLLQRRPGDGSSTGATLLELDCPLTSVGGWHDLQEVDLDFAIGEFSLAEARWRQTDFDEREFRRSFARESMRRAVRGFRSIQVAPVGERDFPKTWVTGTFTVDDNVRIGYPAGSTSLTFHAPAPAPDSWKRLCELVQQANGGSARWSFQTGAWYRMMLSMSMDVDDGLEWDV